MEIISWILLVLSLVCFIAVSTSYGEIKKSKKITIELVNKHTTACMGTLFFSILFMSSLL